MPTIDDPLPSGARRNRLGYGGIVAAAAREAEADVFARCRAILAAGTPLSAGPAIDAASLLLRGDKPLKLEAVARLRELVGDPRTPDVAAVRAGQLILAATGRRAFKDIN